MRMWNGELTKEDVMQQEGRQLSLLPPHQTKMTNIAIIEERIWVSLSTRL